MEINNNLSEKALCDYKIVCRAIAGEEKAYAELFKKYKDSVYFMILKMVNNRTDAEDLMFEAFEKAFTSLNYYSPQFAFSTWLFKIASNNTIDFIRKKKAQLVSLDVDDGFVINSSTPFYYTCQVVLKSFSNISNPHFGIQFYTTSTQCRFLLWNGDSSRLYFRGQYNGIDGSVGNDSYLYVTPGSSFRLDAVYTGKHLYLFYNNILVTVMTNLNSTGLINALTLYQSADLVSSITYSGVTTSSTVIKSQIFA